MLLPRTVNGELTRVINVEPVQLSEDVIKDTESIKEKLDNEEEVDGSDALDNLYK